MMKGYLTNFFVFGVYTFKERDACNLAIRFGAPEHDLGDGLNLPLQRCTQVVKNMVERLYIIKIM